MNCANKPNIDETFIINSTPITPILPCSAVTTDYIYSCTDETLMFDFSGNTINPHVDIVPSEPDVISLGTPTSRFRNINTISGTFEDGLVVGVGAQSYPLHVLSESLSVSIYAAYDIVAYSDISVKENIRPIDNVVDRIKKSRGVVYDRIDNGALDNIGFIAQELEEQFPELVVDNGDEAKAVKYQNGVAVLFEAIKEQQVQIDDLTEKLNNVLKLLNI